MRTSAEGERGGGCHEQHRHACIDAMTELDGGRALYLRDEHTLTEGPVGATEAGAGHAHPRAVCDEAQREHGRHESEPP